MHKFKTHFGIERLNDSDKELGTESESSMTRQPPELNIVGETVHRATVETDGQSSQTESVSLSVSVAPEVLKQGRLSPQETDHRSPHGGTLPILDTNQRYDHRESNVSSSTTADGSTIVLESPVGRVAVDGFNWLADDTIGDEGDKQDGRVSLPPRPTRRMCETWYLLPLWARNTLYFGFALIVLAGPSCFSVYYLQTEINIFDTRVSQWSIFCSISFFMYYIVDWALALILHQIWRQSESKWRGHIENMQSLRRYLSMSFWSLIVWVSWRSVIHNRICPDVTNLTCGGKWALWFVNPMLIGMWVTCLGFMFENLLLQHISMGFHKTAYQERIQKSRFAGAVLDTLLKMAPKTTKKAKEVRIKSHKGNLSSISNLSSSPTKTEYLHSQTLFTTTEETHLAHQAGTEEASPVKSSSTSGGRWWWQKIRSDAHECDIVEPQNPMPTGTYKTEESPADAARIQEMKLSSRQTHSYRVTADMTRFIRMKKILGEVNNAEDAKRLARKIFERLAGAKDELTIVDFEPYFKDKKMLQDAFKIFDVNLDGSISRREMKDVVLGVYRERKNLAKSLTDLEHALSALEKILIAILLFLLTLLWLTIFEVNVVQTFLTLSSMMVASAFITGGTARNSFDSLVFLFLIHPFDVGDRIVIDEINYIVKQIHILTTVLCRTSDGMMVYFTNYNLANKAIHNVRRSGDMTDTVTIDLPFTVDASKLAELRSRVIEYIKGQTVDFVKVEMICTEVVESHRLRANVSYTCHGNFQEGLKRAQRKQLVLMCLKDTMRNLDIEYKGLPQQVLLSSSQKADLTCTQCACGRLEVEFKDKQ